jgi:hypothetical protein
MATRPRFVLPALLLAASQSFATPLMHRAQTVMAIPPVGEEITLSALTYKAKAFEAKIYSVKLEVTSAEEADFVAGQWIFYASNSDGQMHKVEVYTRILAETGEQLAVQSKMCMLSGGSQSFECKVPLKLKAADWKAAKSVRVVTDWMS